MPPPSEPVDVAAQAGLVYADEAMAWRRRIRRGRGFEYREPDGSPVTEEVRAWIEACAIPPAWRDVTIAARGDSHLLATGYDARGRKQYVYHPAWEDVRQELKFARMWEFGARLVPLRKRIDRDLRLPGLPRTKVVALAVAVLDRTLIRVGNRRSAAGGEAYGLTTLTPDHVEVAGSHVHLEFVGKGGGERQAAFRDRRLAALISRCGELAGQSLFSYTAEGITAAIGSDDVNRYLADVMRGHFTAKDFRTWGASTYAAGHLATGNTADPEAAVLAALDATADRLGNTRAVCRDSYVHPTVLDAFGDGRLQEAWRRSRRGAWLQRPESAVSKLAPEV